MTMIWQKQDDLYKGVAEYSPWITFENYQSFQNRAGVYIFAATDLDVKYIGKAGQGRMVKEIYDAIYRDKQKNASLVKALYTNSNDIALSVEKDLINKYDPINNKD